MPPKKETESAPKVKSSKSSRSSNKPAVEACAVETIESAPAAPIASVAPEVEYEEVTLFKGLYDFVSRETVRLSLFWMLQGLHALVIFGFFALHWFSALDQPITARFLWMFLPGLGAVSLATLFAYCASEWMLLHAPQRLLPIDVENVLYVVCAALTAAAHFGASALPSTVAPYADMAVFSFAIVPVYVVLVNGAFWLRRHRAAFTLRKTVRVVKKTE